MLGALLGKYRVVEQLGEGGMGVVYVGRHEQLGNRVVVKVLRPEMSRDADMVKRFFNEAQAATAIRNPGIVQVFDFGTTPDGRAYFVMELLEGMSLGARLKHPIDHASACRIGRQVANVLQAAHAAGITHRDLKPDNLFLVPDGEVVGGERVKVLDFGIAKLAGELGAASVQTRTDIVMGTPSYMSPEQCRGAGTVDSRSDIYALGCILFKMVCGRAPFLGHGAGEIIGAHLHVPPPPPQSLAPDVPTALAELILQMLAKQPEARPQTMTAVAHALDEILRTLPIALSPGTSPSHGAALGSSPMPAMAAPDAAALARSSHPSLPSLPHSDSHVLPSSTTLGGAAGASSYAPRPPARRLPLLLGGLVIAGAAVAIAIVVSRGGGDGDGGDASKRHVSYSDIGSPPVAAAAPAGSAAPAVAPPAPTPPAGSATPAAPPAGSAAAPETDGPIEMEPMPATGDLPTLCQGYLTDRKWREAEACADKLAPTDAASAAALKAKAVEGRSTARLAAAELALRDKNLKKAKAELDAVSPQFPGHSRMKRKYTEAEDQAISDLAFQLDRVKDRDCDEYNDLLAAERAAKPPRVATEAARRTPCARSK